MKRYRFGFGYDREASRVDVGPVRASGLAVEEMWHVTSTTVSTIAQIFVPEKREEIGSVVGGYNETRKAFELDATTAFLILALISLSLGVINLFPFLPLDGGHIFWALAEKVRGRPIPFSVMERAGFVGFALVIMLFFVGVTNDIGRIANGARSSGSFASWRAHAPPTIAEAFRLTVEDHPDQLAVSGENLELTWSQLRDRSDAFAGTLAKLGVNTGTPSR